MSHEIETKEHPDGRKDVIVKVGTLDVKGTDQLTKDAKHKIESEVIPALANARVLVTVIHKFPEAETGYLKYAAKIVRATDVRKYALACFESFKEMHPDVVEGDFVVHEHHIDSKEVKVTTL